MRALETTSTLSVLGTAAIDYAKRGLAVFPLAENSKVPCIAEGFKRATTDVEQIAAWWDYRPNCNIGIATGGVSGGLVVIDCDYDAASGEDGMQTVRSYETSEGEFPEGACVSTPRGGEHLYFISDEPFDCSTNADKGVDIRADGGYVVAPPSVHPNGGVYEWDMHIDDYGIPKANKTVLAFIRKLQGERKSESFKLPEEIKRGERNDILFKLACSMQAKGEDDDVIYAYCVAVNTTRCKPPMADNEVNTVVSQALKYQKGEGQKHIPGNVGQVSTMLRVNDKGVPYQTIANCETVLLNDVRLAGRFTYNVMAYTKYVQCPLPWDQSEGVRPITDADYASLTAYMEREYLLKSKEKAIDAVLTTCTANKYNPVTEWLASLKWDGSPRVASLLTMYLGCTLNDYNISVLKLWMRGAIARAFEPGVKFDTMLVLKGPQGIGKSEFLRKMAHNPDWFHDNFNTVEGDAAAEKLRGMWIVEIAELLAVKNAKEVEGVKSFITSRIDKYRPKYARETEARPRVCVFSGSTNSDSFLTDPTGNRRFLIVECHPEDAVASIIEDKDAQDFIDQCWAEVMDEWRGGDRRLTLPEEFWDEAERMRDKYTEDDPRIGVIQEYLDNLPGVGRGGVRVCVKEILDNALKMERDGNPPKKLINEIHAIMSNQIEGWMMYPCAKNGKARCVGYGIQKCYVPKADYEYSDGAWRELF